MTADQGAQAGYLALILVLVLLSLGARRLQLGRVIGYLLSWAAIFVGAYLLFVNRDAFRPMFDRVTTDLRPATPQIVGKTVRIAMSPDGHFWVDAKIGGDAVRFLVDSGATMTAISPETLAKAELETDDRRPMILRTANGDIRADRVTIPTLAVGSIRVEDLDAVSSPGFGGINVLGMNFLSGLQRWGVEDRTLILTPKTSI
ncbi:TIGR02281 family clan AA aspartic protease [Sphingomonas arantia]|uniref:TIGR02281 family clan AA aspartic protease n=1 Tax=Sphingomonas arantia TaxID=1460676 RepID=A0ABW4TYQ1_9SPHN